MSAKKKRLNILASVFIISALVFTWSVSSALSAKPQIWEEDEKFTELLASFREYRESLVTTTTMGPPPTLPDYEDEPVENITPRTYYYIECETNTDCGINGTYTTKDYTCYKNDIYRQYIQYRCEKPGTPEAKCVGTEKISMLDTCAAGERCVEGEPYCAYEKNVVVEKNPWIPVNATLLDINNEDYAYYKGYRIRSIYLISQQSQPKGVTIDIIKPDGTEVWEFIYEKGGQIDDMVIGFKRLEKLRFAIKAKLWIQDLEE